MQVRCWCARSINEGLKMHSLFRIPGNFDFTSNTRPECTHMALQHTIQADSQLFSQSSFAEVCTRPGIATLQHTDKASHVACRLCTRRKLTALSTAGENFVECCASFQYQHRDISTIPVAHLSLFTSIIRYRHSFEPQQAAHRHRLCNASLNE